MTEASAPPGASRPADSLRDSRWFQILTGGAAVLWIAIALLLSLMPVSDQDLGFHISWGRILLHHFGGARSLLLGQDSSVSVYAYGYWLYQVTVASLFAHLGAWGLVLFRAGLILGTLALAFFLARRLGSSLWAGTIALALGILVAHERFVDRPDVFSHLALVAAFWILILHRHDRRVWWLVPLQILWVNTHLFFSLLPALWVAFTIGDALEGHRGFRRAVLILGALILATFVNPVGPLAWLSQLKLAGVTTGTISPIELREHVSPYSSYQPFLALWGYRFWMPLCLVLILAARKRIGWGAILAFLIPTALSLLARRAMSLFAVAAVALAPAALDDLFARIPAAAARVSETTAVALALIAGLVGFVGLANGRILLAQDKALAIANAGTLRFPATDASRLLRNASLEGPIFHTPAFAGAILMENGTRLTPFLDPRWCGTDDENQVYLKLTAARDADIATVWDAIERSHGFETVLLDFYEMPALLRHLAADPGWALIFADDGAAVFCRRGGKNAGAISQLEPAFTAARAKPDPAREAELGRLVSESLRRPKASLLAALHFPWASFQRANFALQVGSRPDAEAAYLDFFRHEAGSLDASPHRSDVLSNVLWCLSESDQWEARAALCTALASSRDVDPARRKGLELARAQALLRLGRNPEAERAAIAVAADPAAGADSRWLGWTYVASAREAAGNHEGAVEALRSAARDKPGSAETWRAMGAILDAELSRPADALPAYRAYQSLGGQDPRILARIRELEGSGGR